jgi:hypothetical protein
LSGCVRDGFGVHSAARNLGSNQDCLGYGDLVLSDGDGRRVCVYCLGDGRRMCVYCFGDLVGGINASNLAGSSGLRDYVLSRTNGYCLGCPDCSSISLYQSRQGQCRGSERRTHYEVALDLCVRISAADGLDMQSLYS